MLFQPSMFNMLRDNAYSIWDSLCVGQACSCAKKKKKKTFPTVLTVYI